MSKFDEERLAAVLTSSERLDILNGTGLLDSPAEASFDRLTRLAARLLHAPVALISLVDDHRQFFKSSLGLPEPWACLRETPLTHSFCQYVVRDAKTLIVEDATKDPVLCENRAVSELGVIAYLGVPIVHPSGVLLGSFCVTDGVPRQWSEAEVEAIVDLAESVNSEISLRLQIAERAQSEQRAGRFKSLVDHSGDFIAMANLDAGVTYVNPAGRHLVGLTETEDLGGKTIPQFLTEETVSLALAEAIPAALNQGQWSGGGQLKHFGDGHAIDVEINFFLVKDQRTDQPSAFATILRDVTARKANKRKLIESEMRFRNSFDNAPIGMAIISLDHRWVSVNLAICEILGYSTEELLATDYKTLFTPDDIASDLEFRRKCIAGEFTRYQSEKRCIHKTGYDVWVSRSVSLVHDEDGKPLYFIDQIQDVTERHRFEAHLRQAKELAETANRAKSDFLANMSHELRTPLAAILGYTDILLDPTMTPADHEQGLQAIQRNGGHLLQLINDILDLSKIEANKLELDLIDYSPWQVVLETVSTLQGRADEMGVSLRFEPLGPLPDKVRIDPTRYRQILVNLVSNAIKFTPVGKGVAIRMSFDATVEGRTAELIVSIEDHGIGINPEQRTRLFLPFQQGDNSTTRKYGGTGLGLSITQRLVDAMEGRIIVQSTPGVGSTFEVRIPVCAHQDAKWVANHERETEPASVPVRLTGRLLLAEDSFDNRRILLYYLNQAGLQTDIAENGRIAVEKALASDYDVVLMDMHMPEFDGYDAVRSLRASGYSHPIVALTANAMKADRAQCLAAGCSDYLSKPVLPKDLIGCLANYLPIATPRLPDPSFADCGLGDLVRDYVASLPERITRVSHALAVRDYKTVRTLVHQTHGIAGMYGFTELGEAAGFVESALVEEREDELITDLVHEFIGFAQGIVNAAEPKSNG